MIDTSAIVSIVSAGAALSGAAVMVFQARANKKKLEADAKKTEAEAVNVTAVTGLEGAKVIKDISEAAAFLLVPYRTENEELRKRMNSLESEMSQVKEQYKLTLEQLHREREQAAIAQIAYEERTKDLVRSYEARISELKESLDEVRAQVALEALKRNGMATDGSGTEGSDPR